MSVNTKPGGYPARHVTAVNRFYSSTVTPQLMLPLVGDLAPPHRRASALSIVVSGLALGLLIARVLSGIMANFTSWRNIYWLVSHQNSMRGNGDAKREQSFGAQCSILILLFFFLPDYPAKERKLPYFHLLWDIIKLIVKEPVLLQACLTGFLLSAAFTSFWTTLTFLLASPPYLYSSLEIGFFAFIGIAVITLGPLWSRLITDRFVPLFSVVGFSPYFPWALFSPVYGGRYQLRPVLSNR
jgi:MFS family permease